MNREQAIFFETMDDLNYEGYTQLLILAYHDFISGFDFSVASDVEVHSRAKHFIKHYQPLWKTDIDFHEIRWGILDNLDLDDAEWEYLDIEGNREEPV